MWAGVTKGLAEIKFSQSPNKKGLVKHNIINIIIIITTPSKSLIEKKGWNEILSELELTPIGLLEPDWWRNNKWIITKADTTKGRRKCKEKNRVKVALSTENPPQTHWTKSNPI